MLHVEHLSPACIRVMWALRLCLLANNLPQLSHGQLICFCWCQDTWSNGLFFKPFKASLASSWLANETRAPYGSPLYFSLRSTIFPYFEKNAFNSDILFVRGAIPVTYNVSLEFKSAVVLGERFSWPISISMVFDPFPWKMKHSLINSLTNIFSWCYSSTQSIFPDGICTVIIWRISQYLIKSHNKIC